MKKKPSPSLKMNQNGHFEFCYQADKLKNQIPAAKTEVQNLLSVFCCYYVFTGQLDGNKLLWSQLVQFCCEHIKKYEAFSNVCNTNSLFI